VVKAIKRRFQLAKVGHGGTLDPLATGVLIIGINQGTKLLTNCINHRKEYITTIQFGLATDTYDITGKKVTNMSYQHINLDDIDQALQNFKNYPYHQMPPMYSAKKVNGRKLYQYARKQLPVITKPSLVQLYDYQILYFHLGILQLKIVVSKGFYVRSLAHDLAQKLNTVGCITSLIRTKSGNFDITHAVSLKALIN
jgi:tRNA pseudouridine55 synthase